jgi:hypothetical protein
MRNRFSSSGARSGGKRRVRCLRTDRPQGHPTWHSVHAAEHCQGKLCRWQKAGQASRCPMKRGA